MSFPTRATAYAPGSIGNFGPGLDVLGCAVEGACDTVSAEFTDARGVTVVDPGHPSLSTDPTMHASAIAAMAVVRRATHLGATTPAAGIALHVTKGLPLSAGQGGSAASAVAGAAAVNALIGSPLSRDELLEAALFSETQVAGRHLDNIAPSYMGGIVLIRSLDPIDVLPAGQENELLEPGSGAPDIKKILERVRASQVAASGKAVDAEGRTDFIAAARRAAQAAAMETSPEKLETGKKSRKADASALSRYRRPLLLGIGAILLAMMAMPLVKTLIGGAEAPAPVIEQKIDNAPVSALPETGDNSKLVIKLSQAAFDQLKAVNQRFPVEVLY